ncbi:hypothetical protein L1987_62783 [Smallanthus sonchifolius]|uniref:Uncharacterized protein n=1 Tax=Smallanthus sonchifolius TaxID=185202 RepID=A0ACB9CBF4_9ASTR|nr:hypothetical protein L1987_62783 [Smallanthus sonchifolius]
MDRIRHLSVQGAKSFIQGPELSSEFPYGRDHYFLESLKEKSWIERPGKWSKGPCPKAAKPFPATWKRRACSGNSNGRLSLIRTKLVGVASSKQLPLAPIDEKEIELEKSKEDFDPVMALASFPLWDHLAFVGLRFPVAKSFTPFTE